MLLELTLALSAPAADQTQYFFHLSFNSTLQLIYGILSYLQKLHKYYINMMTQSLFHFSKFH